METSDAWGQPAYDARLAAVILAHNIANILTLWRCDSHG